MFSMCSELTPLARIPDTRIPQLMQPWLKDSKTLSSDQFSNFSPNPTNRDTCAQTSPPCPIIVHPPIPAPGQHPCLRLFNGFRLLSLSAKSVQKEGKLSQSSTDAKLFLFVYKSQLNDYFTGDLSCPGQHLCTLMGTGSAIML